MDAAATTRKDSASLAARPASAPSPIAVDIAAAAALLGVSERYLSTLRYRGGGPPFIRVGGPRRGRILYRVETLKAWTAAREQTSTAAEAGAA
jgi:hypothetical protein